jgi:hypothetical protein
MFREIRGSARGRGSKKISSKVKSPKRSNKIMGKATKVKKAVKVRKIGGRH